jgi:hypothetical protein
MHGVNCCCTICLEYLNYGVRSFTVYEKHSEIGGGLKLSFSHCSFVYFF